MRIVPGRAPARWVVAVGGLAVIGIVFVFFLALGVFGRGSGATSGTAATSDPAAGVRGAAQRFATAMVTRDAGAVSTLICDPTRAGAFARELTDGPDHTTAATLDGAPRLTGDTALQRVRYQVMAGDQRQSGVSEIVLRRRGADWCVTDVTAAG